jgi:uncharacterized protein (DUF4415 family)
VYSRGSISTKEIDGRGNVLSLAEKETGAEAHWNRPRKRRVSLRVDIEVVDWFQSKDPGYQTQINRISRWVMVEGRSGRERDISPICISSGYAAGSQRNVLCPLSCLDYPF